MKAKTPSVPMTRIATIITRIRERDNVLDWLEPAKTTLPVLAIANK